jgi:hypothetical protein
LDWHTKCNVDLAWTYIAQPSKSAGNFTVSCDTPDPHLGIHKD